MADTRAPALVVTALLALAACAGPAPAADPAPASPASVPTTSAPAAPAAPGDDPDASLEHLADGLVYDPSALVLPADAGAHFAATDLSTFAVQAVEAFDVVMETSEQTQRPDGDGPLLLEYFEPVAGHLTPSAWTLLVTAFESGDQPTVSALVPSSALVPPDASAAAGEPAEPGAPEPGTAPPGDPDGGAATEQVGSIEPYRPTGQPTVALVVPEPGAARLAVTFSYQRVFGAPDGERVYDTDHTLYLVPVEGRWLVDGWRTSYPTLAP
ncbi:hypothetical protein [Cellulomonas sp. NS3]|uniref:hypothetical protein n=1 Tax=Cellulomonas sp. NS3 TaxID=2973977 RepID=UPI002162F7C2|nr:hypothetical protein [Cellulomonas sp. NS3]